MYSPEALCGLLALAAGLRRRSEPTTPTALLSGFGWSQVRSEDRTLRWTGSELVVHETAV